MKWSRFASFRNVHPSTVTIRPIISRSDVPKQMLILMQQVQLQWIPVLGKNYLVYRCPKSRKFLFGRLQIPYTSAILPSYFSHGKPLPHPVDGSFVYMVIDRVVKQMHKRRAPEEKWREAELKGHLLYHYTKVQQSGKLPTPKYSSIKRELLLQSGLVELNARGDFQTLSLNDVYFEYINKFKG